MKGLAAVGDVLGGKYRVDKILGIGGMGMVVAATHLELDQRVALKFMLPAANESVESSARFLREARAAGRLNSEHVCRVIDVGRFETGVPYIVMEYLQGENFAARLRRRGPLRVSEAVDLMMQAIEGLAEAHAHGIIHRDLKPDNLFLHKRNDGGSIVKVLDFGISKLAVAGASTRTGDIMGSPAYMAPEQMESSRNVDHRADVWSLGVVLYQLVVGKPPFHGETLPLLCLHVVNDDPEPMSVIRDDLPDGFEAVVMRCLRKEPEDRYADVGELATALAPYGPRHATTSASRIQVVLQRTSKDSASTISHEFTRVAPTFDRVDGLGAVPAVRDRLAEVRAATPGTSSGTSSGAPLVTLRTGRGARSFVGAIILGLGLVALGIGVAWPSGQADLASRPRAEPIAAPEPRRPPPIVEPILEDEPAPADPAAAPAADPVAADTAPAAVITELAPAAAGQVSVGKKAVAKKRTPRRSGAGGGKARVRAGSGSAGAAGPDGDEAGEDDDKWNHMTHDDDNQP